MEKLIYFSLNEKTIKAFHNYVKKNRYEYQFSFSLVALDEYSYSHVSDLSNYLEQQKSLSHLKVIIDYVSLTCPNKKETIKEAQESIRRIILKYPEVFFLFDETGSGTNEYNFSFSDFLLPGCKELVDTFLFKEYHQFDAKKKDSISGNPFPFLKRSRNNLFDGSNLRYIVKRYLYGDLKVGKHNFGIIQGNRANNLALCVEEEEDQNRFNCYALYSNGYRVLPVLSANELKYFNTKHDLLKPAIITRDYDLQFDDIIQPSPKTDCYEVDLVRGYKYIEEEKKWKSLTKRSEYWNNLIDKYPILFITKGHDNLEVKLAKPRKEDENNSDKSDALYVDGFLQEEFKSNTDEGNILHVQGLYKPVPGIYYLFKNFNLIKENSSEIITSENGKWLIEREIAYRVFHEEYERLLVHQKFFKEKNKEYKYFFETKLLDEGTFNDYSKYCEKIINEDQQKIEFVIGKYKSIIDSHEEESALQYKVINSNQSGDYFWLHQIYSIQTSRADHDHGVPLNVYYMVKEMVDRAKVYYEDKRYIRAAIVSWDAIEVMNGFHETLLLDAYRIYALSENAIAINILGGKEEELTEDTRFRVWKIQEDVKRILYRGNKKKYRDKFAINTLNQIFSECRAFCKQKEHFESEEVFISAIGRLNNSDPLYSWCHELWEKIREKRYEKEYRCQLNEINTSIVIPK